MLLKVRFFIIVFTLSFCNLGFSQIISERSCPRLLMQSETEGETAFCQSFSVPERWDGSSSQSIELAIMTLKAKTDTAKADPIIFLQGGPGGAALSTIEFWQDLVWRESRDIILVDQRGTGYGEPNLKCPELYRNVDFKRASQDCRERLREQGYDLTSFNSAENAQDISALIQALDLENVNLYGVSYGTRLALTMMRDAPEGIRTVVLDSTYPPQAQRLMEFGDNFERALDQIFEGCASSESCSSAYPDLKDAFFETITYLDRNPSTQFLTELEFGAQEILSILFQAMYDEDVITSLPYAFEKLSEDDFNSFIVIVAGLATAEDLDNGEFNFFDVLRGLTDVFKFIWREVQSEGVYFSTECPEDVFFQNYRLVRRQTESLPPALQELANDTALQMFSVCRAWRSPRGTKLESQAVSSDIPTLVLAGSFDPITPPEWGQRAASTLSNSYFFEFPNAAHGVFASGDCAVSMIESFLDSPNASPDATCMEEIEFNFYTPE